MQHCGAVRAAAADKAPEQQERSYEELKKHVTVIAKPLADEKLCKKALKVCW